ncbi:MAG: TPM domain-containing protein [Proteobacteria bacterium]|nr:TPM domain-containing protein [Pseudomonadota bacterium]
MIHLTQSDQDKISKAVLEAELLTTGEIVPMVVTQSDDYPGARWRLAIVTAMFFGFLAYFFLGDFDPAWILWVQIPGLYIGYWLGTISTVLRPFLESSKVDEEVHQRALQAFISRDLHATKDRTGILIMASLFERRVEILADTGINAKVSSDTWQGIVADMIGRIKSDDLTEGFCIAVRECGEVLAKDFPGSHDNPDELSNKVVIE